PTVWFRDLDSSHRLRLVAIFEQLLFDPRPVLHEERLESLDGHPVHSPAPAIRHDSFQRTLEVLAFENVLHRSDRFRRALGCVCRHERFGPLAGYPRGFTPALSVEVGFRRPFLPPALMRKPALGRSIQPLVGT